MNQWDEQIKAQVQNENWQIPEQLDLKIEEILEGLPEEEVFLRKGLNKSIKIALVVATLVSATLCIAATPVGQEVIRNFISYFDTTTTLTYSADEKLIEAYRTGTLLSKEDQGICFTVEDLALDDSFLYIFYTIQGSEPVDLAIGKRLDEYDDKAPLLWAQINGRTIESNLDDDESYLEDAYTLRGIKRISLARTTLEDKLKIDIQLFRVFGKEGEWNITTLLDKTTLQTASKVYEVGKTYKINREKVTSDLTIERVILSPLGNQIVISEKLNGDETFTDFALFDDKGSLLQIVPSGLYVVANQSHEITKSLEFIGDSVAMKDMILVPIERLESGMWSMPEPIYINQLPITVPIGELGSITVQTVEVKGEYLEVTYQKEGILLNRGPLFEAYAGTIKIENGVMSEVQENLRRIPLIDPSSNPGGGRIISIDRVNGIYTTVLQIDTERGGKIEDLKAIDFLELYAAPYIKLLKEQSIKIELQD